MAVPAVRARRGLGAMSRTTCRPLRDEFCGFVSKNKHSEFLSCLSAAGIHQPQHFERCVSVVIAVVHTSFVCLWFIISLL